MKKARLFILCLFMIIFSIYGIGTIRSFSTSGAVSKTAEGSVTEVDSGLDDGKLEVHFIDAGQGDATLITCGGEAMLIDAGDNSKGTAVWMYLKKQNITKLNYVIGTHPDADHIGGLDVIITKSDCDTILMPGILRDTDTYRDVISAMDYKGYKQTIPVNGEKYTLGDAEFTIVSSDNTSTYADNINNWSVSILLRYGDTKFLFTGDAEEQAESDMVNSDFDLSCDVYKVGHHGSSSSSSPLLLDAAGPAYAVISCGEDNTYGHPRAETLNNLRSRGIKVFRTDEQGSVIAVSDGNTVSFDIPPSDTWKAGEPSGTQDRIQEGTQGGTQDRRQDGTQDKSTPDVKSGTSGGTQSQQDAGIAAEEAAEAELSYVLNTSTMKFHKPDCGSLPTKNRKDTGKSRDEIIAQGYAPCKICSP